MDCQEIQKLIPAYVDGELDLRTALSVEQHLPDCPDCAQAMESLAALRSKMKEPSLQYKAPHSLRLQIEQSLAPQIPQPRRMQINRWPAVGIGTAVAAVLAAASYLYVANRPQPVPVSGQNELVAEAVNDHVRSQASNGLALIQVASSDSHTVKPWLSAHLSFSPPAPDLADHGFVLKGGRVDALLGHDVAALVYGKGNHIINVFVWPVQGPVDACVHSQMQQGFTIMTWSARGMNFCAVSDTSESNLQQLANLLSAPPAPTSIP